MAKENELVVYTAQYDSVTARWRISTPSSNCTRTR